LHLLALRFGLGLFLLLFGHANTPLMAFMNRNYSNPAADMGPSGAISRPCQQKLDRFETLTTTGVGGIYPG
jgi:hypothetical protein